MSFLGKQCIAVFLVLGMALALRASNEVSSEDKSISERSPIKGKFLLLKADIKGDDDDDDAHLLEALLPSASSKKTKVILATIPQQHFPLPPMPPPLFLSPLMMQGVPAPPPPFAAVENMPPGFADFGIGGVVGENGFRMSPYFVDDTRTESAAAPQEPKLAANGGDFGNNGGGTKTVHSSVVVEKIILPPPNKPEKPVNGIAENFGKFNSAEFKYKDFGNSGSGGSSRKGIKMSPPTAVASGADGNWMVTATWPGQKSFALSSTKAESDSESVPEPEPPGCSCDPFTMRTQWARQKRCLKRCAGHHHVPQIEKIAA